MIFKRFERHALVLLFIATIFCASAALNMLFTGGTAGGKWLASSGLLSIASGVVQLEVSGLFQKIMDVYGDEEKYPYGPPSHITRQIIDDPDRPVIMWVRNVCFFNIRTGFWLIVGGTFIQLAAVWL